MTAKNKKVVESALALAFLNIADNRQIETHEIDGLGKIGLKELSVGLRDEWSKIKDDSIIWLVQNTVCDPESGEFVLKQIEVARLKELPSKIIDGVVDLVFKQNGFKVATKKEVRMESQELKNSEANQS